jgi:hypothetical protein
MGIVFFATGWLGFGTVIFTGAGFAATIAGVVATGAGCIFVGAGLLATALAGFVATVGFVATAWFGINRFGFNIGVAPVETGWLGFGTGIFAGAGLAATIAGVVAPGAG